jgi:arylsulfatase A-like enzyme
MDQTLIVFTSLSGDLLSHHGLWGAGDASDPVNMYEESVRTPMIWVRPGQVPAQLSRPELVSAYDFVPSLCETLLIDPPSRNLCGRSYMLMATGKPLPKKEPWRATVFAHYQYTGMARNQRYKLVLRESGKGRSELYALNTDPAEKVNQYDSPEFVTVRNSLTAELNGWKQRFGT